MSSPERVNPLAGLDLGSPDEFAPKPKVKPRASEADVEKISEENNFPSRQPPKKKPAKKEPRRRTTGRNQQLNIKATAECIEKFYRLADENDVPLGELLDRALDALEKMKTP